MPETLEKPMAPTSRTFKSKSGDWKYDLITGEPDEYIRLEVNQCIHVQGDGTNILCTLLSCPKDFETFCEIVERRSADDIEEVFPDPDSADLFARLLNELAHWRQHKHHFSDEDLALEKVFDAYKESAGSTATDSDTADMFAGAQF